MSRELRTGEWEFVAGSILRRGNGSVGFSALTVASHMGL